MVAPEPTSALLSAAATKKLVATVAADLYDLAKKKLGVTLRGWKAKKHSEAAYKRLRQLRLVKTILQSEKEVDLATFYYPSSIALPSDKRRVVHRLSDLGHDGSVLIEGTVGQGKSIFLRYLAFAEFCATRRVPVFIELRRMKPGQTLRSAALNELAVLGFDVPEEVFLLFVAEGRLLLFLDAFDEVKEELKQDLLLEAEELIRQHEALRIVMTSRPGSGAAALSRLRVFELSPLAAGEYEHVIRKMAHRASTAAEIVKGIDSEAAQVRHLLTTPLMVALLMVRYRIDHTLPQNSAAFFDSLFLLLLQRHDKMKAGYVRPRKSGLGDYALQEVFNAFCFVTRKAEETAFARRQLVPRARAALDLTQHADDAEKVVTDIIEITCLILADDEECRFIHKSVQEYHAALFVKNQPDAFAIKFYDAMSTNRRWSSWRQELYFLAEIDRYRYLKHFHISQLEMTLGDAVTADAPEHLQDRTIARLFGGDEISSAHGESPSVTVGSSGHYWPTWTAMGGSDYLTVLFDAHQDLDGVNRPGFLGGSIC